MVLSIYAKLYIEVTTTFTRIQINSKYFLPFIKLNWNYPEDEKTGSGPGSCKAPEKTENTQNLKIKSGGFLANAEIKPTPFDVSKYSKDAKEISTEQVMAQAKASDIYSKMDENLKEISSGPSTIQKLSGKLDDSKVNSIVQNAKNESKSYAKYLAGDTAILLRDYIDVVGETLKDPAFKNVDASSMNSLIVDSIQKLMHQEVESSRQSFTDHGIRHIVGNIQRQDAISTALNGGIPVDARTRLMGIVSMINHDIGYTTPLIREGGLRGIQLTKFHEKMSGSILAEQKDQWNSGKIFTEDEFSRMCDVVSTHSMTTIDKKDVFATSLRLSDNLALFANEKLPSVFKYVEGGIESLMKMGQFAKDKDENGFDNEKIKLWTSIDNNTKISDNLKRDLKSSTSSIDFLTPKFTLGVLAGEISKISCGDQCDKKEPKVFVDINYNGVDAKLQTLFDMGQKQTKKFLEDYGVTDFSKDEYTIGDSLILRIHG